MAGSAMGEAGVAFSVISPASAGSAVHADRQLPHQLAGLRVQLDQDAGLAAVDDHRLPVGGGEHRRVLQVPVEQVVRGELVVPQQLALRAQLDDRVGVQVRTGPAGAPRVALGPAALPDRAGVRDSDVEVARAVERRRIPQAAAGVEARLPPQVLHLVPGPFRFAGGGVQRPQGRLGAAQVLALVRVDGHGGDVHGAVVVAGGHVDALEVVADQGPAPQLLAGGRRQGDRGAVRRRVHGSADDIDAVRAAVQRVVGVRPQDLAGGEPDRHHVRLLILGVDHAIHHDRRRGVAIRQASGMGYTRRLDRHAPRHAQLRHVRAGDRAGDIPRVRQVAARQRPVRRGPRRGGLDTLRQATRRGRAAGAPAAAGRQARRHHQRYAGHCGPPHETPHLTHLLPGCGACHPHRGAVLAIRATARRLPRKIDISMLIT